MLTDYRDIECEITHSRNQNIKEIQDLFAETLVLRGITPEDAAFTAETKRLMEKEYPSPTTSGKEGGGGGICDTQTVGINLVPRRGFK